MSGKLSMDFIENFEKWGAGYFSDIKKIKMGIFDDFKEVKGLNKVDREFESRICNILTKDTSYEKDSLDIECIIGWKRGYTTYEKIKAVRQNDSWSNDRGARIKNLNEYIDYLYDNQENIKGKFRDSGDIKELYDALRKNVPNYFGIVYIINLMYFFTNGEVPIYDQFAFRALKALMFEKKPWEVFLSTVNPDKKNTQDALGFISEYMWYMDHLFGTHKIDRKLDRALWVYGHLKERNSEIVNVDGLYVNASEVTDQMISVAC